MSAKEIYIARDFSRYPAGRYRSDGRYSGERFREEFLVPALVSSDTVRIFLDGTLGYGSSFLEEAFGGILRKPDFNHTDILKKIELFSDDTSLILEIKGYLGAQN